MSSPILDMENINMRLGPSNMGRCGNGRGVHFGGVTMHPLTVGHPTPFAHRLLLKNVYHALCLLFFQDLCRRALLHFSVNFALIFD